MVTTRAMTRRRKKQVRDQYMYNRVSGSIASDLQYMNQHQRSMSDRQARIALKRFVPDMTLIARAISTSQVHGYTRARRHYRNNNDQSILHASTASLYVMGRNGPMRIQINIESIENV